MYISQEAMHHIAVLKKLNTNDSMLKYCNANLQKVGNGSSRVVYALSSNLVIKIAKGSVGVKQNENEIRIWNLVDYSFTGMKRSFAKIYIDLCHWKDFFVVMERLETKTVSTQMFNFRSLQAWRTSRKCMDKTAKRIYNDVQATDDNAFTNNIADLMPRNMGTSKRGVVKMLDYGFSTEIWNKLATGKLRKRELLVV